MAELLIFEKSPVLIKAKNNEGKILMIGKHKHPLLFHSFKDKTTNDKIIVDVIVSEKDPNRLVSFETKTSAQSEDFVDDILFKRRMRELKLKQLESLLEL
jgi:hypothetical protein